MTNQLTPADDEKEVDNFSTGSKWAWLILLFPLLFLLLLFSAYVLLNKNAVEQSKTIGPSYNSVLRTSDELGINLKSGDLQEGFKSISEDYIAAMNLLADHPGDTLEERIAVLLETDTGNDSDELKLCLENNKSLLSRIDNLNSTCSMANSCKVSATNQNVVCNVYFGTDAKDFSKMNESFIRDIFNKYTASEYGSITVDSHTDTAGESSYNLILSKRRAEVAAALISQYFSGAVSVFPTGENNPPFKSGDNENDPRNRVVIVTLNYDG